MRREGIRKWFVNLCHYGWACYYILGNHSGFLGNPREVAHHPSIPAGWAVSCQDEGR